MSLLDQRYIKRLAILFGKDFTTSDGNIEPNFLEYFQEAAGIESRFMLTDSQENINMAKGKAVVINMERNIELADSNNDDHIQSLIGVTVSKGELGIDIPVRFLGKVSNENWTWIMDQPIFLGTNGELTQEVPTTGFIKVIGNPSDNHTIWVNPETSIKLV